MLRVGSGRGALASSLEDSELHPSPLLPGPSDLPQLRDVVLDPIITGVGTDEIAFFGDEAIVKERERYKPRVQQLANERLFSLPHSSSPDLHWFSFLC